MSTERVLHQFDAKSAERPTRNATETNTHTVPCGVCGETFYVDEPTYETVQSALDYEPADNPFTCDACEAEYGEEEHAR